MKIKVLRIIILILYLKKKLPPLERCTVVISPQKNEFNVYKVLDGKLRLKEKSTYQGMKNYLNYKSER